MFKNTKPICSAAIVAGLILLTGCTRSVSDVDSQGKTTAPVFPEVSSATLPEGSYVNQNNLMKVREGMSKAQLYELLGAPHFSEGVIRVKEWDYIFNFVTKNDIVRTCQFKVLFDADMKARSFYYKPANCLNEDKPETVKAATHPEREIISAKALFASGSAEIRPEGKQQIQQLIAKIKNNNAQTKQILITGHTDRIGNEQQNMALSFARADAVKMRFVKEGFAASSIETQGMGSSQPVAICPGKNTPDVIACLAQNRRITVDVME